MRLFGGLFVRRGDLLRLKRIVLFLLMDCYAERKGDETVARRATLEEREQAIGYLLQDLDIGPNDWWEQLEAWQKLGGEEIAREAEEFLSRRAGGKSDTA